MRISFCVYAHILRYIKTGFFKPYVMAEGTLVTRKAKFRVKMHNGAITTAEI